MKIKDLLQDTNKEIQQLTDIPTFELGKKKVIVNISIEMSLQIRNHNPRPCVSFTLNTNIRREWNSLAAYAFLM